MCNAGFVNGSEFADPCTPAPAAGLPVTSSASSTPPTAKADLPSVKKRPKRSKSGAKGDSNADAGMLDVLLNIATVIQLYESGTLKLNLVLALLRISRISSR